MIHLAPYDIVARVLLSESLAEIKGSIEEEIRVINFLKKQGLNVVYPCSRFKEIIQIHGYWVSFWRYFEKDNQKKLTLDVALNAILNLTETMKIYKGNLIKLGVWHRALKAASIIRKSNDVEVIKLLEHFDEMNDYIQQLPDSSMVSSHGDAHIRNLYPSKEWIWMDFEDACLMPKYWDEASFVANSALFNGLDSKLPKAIIDTIDLDHRKVFYKLLKARVLMSIVTNLAEAWQGLGDLDFATDQLSRYKSLFLCIEDDIQLLENNSK